MNLALGYGTEQFVFRLGKEHIHEPDYNHLWKVLYFFCYLMILKSGLIGM